jgi:hypothetical protein
MTKRHGLYPQSGWILYGEAGNHAKGAEPMRLSRLACYVCLISLMLVSCRGSRPPELREYETASELILALEEAGASVVETTMMGDPAYPGVTKVIQVEGELVQVVEYEIMDERREVSDRIASEGAALEGALAWSAGSNLWASGNLVVVYAGTNGGVILLLSGLLGDPLTYVPSDTDEPYPPGVTSAISELARQLDADPAQIGVVAYESVEWPDSCLGLPEPKEACAEVITPGWRVRLELNDVVHELHSDQLGEQIRGLK